MWSIAVMHVMHEMVAWGRCASSAPIYLCCFYFISQSSDRVEDWKRETVKENYWIRKATDPKKRDNWRCMNKPTKHGHLKADISSRQGVELEVDRPALVEGKKRLIEENETKEGKEQSRQMDYQSLKWQWQIPKILEAF